MTNLTIYLIRGLPGSGKSTLAKKMMIDNPDLVHVEADDYFTKLDGSYQYDPSKIKDAHECCYINAANALKQGLSVIVANTFSRKWEMENYYRLAGSFGADVRVINCTGNWPNVHNVPQDVIDRMHNRWEK